MNKISDNNNESVWFIQYHKIDGKWIPERLPFIKSTFHSQYARTFSTETHLHQIPTHSPSTTSSLFHIPIQIICNLFLPRDYPQSVHDGYLEYQMYDSVQGLCSYVRGTISTSAILTVAGVGNAHATTWNAVIQWAMKDGMGMLGGLVFSYFTASHFDSHIKEFRLFADVVNDVGLFLDMLGPYFIPSTSSTTVPSLVWILSSIATLCRVMCGMAAGATKGSITQHFSKHNLADLNSKEGTQETLISLLGMIIGIFLARYLQQVEQVRHHDDGKYIVQVISWIIFTLLTLIHIWANYKAVSILRLRSLNQLRAEYAIGPLIRRCKEVIEFNSTSVSRPKPWREYFNSHGEDHPTQQEQLPLMILPPQQVFESFLTHMFRMKKVPIYIGSDLHKTTANVPLVQLQHALCYEFQHEKYILFMDPRVKTNRNRPIHVSLRVEATEDDILKALTHALILRSLLLESTCDLDEDAGKW